MSAEDKSKKILLYLREQYAVNAETAVRTQDISENLCGKRQRKYANPHLYRLKKEGKLDMCLDDQGKNPKWFLLGVEKEEENTISPEMKEDDNVGGWF